MSVSLILLKQLVTFFFMMVMGFLIVKTKVLKSEDSKSLSKIIVYILLPCVVINAFQIEFTQDKLIGLMYAIIASFIVHFILFGVIGIGNKIFKWDGIESATVMYSNAGNMVIPIVSSVLGPEWVFYTSAFIGVQFLFVFTHGNSIISEKREFKWKSIYTNIDLIAVVFGALLFALRIKLPSIVTSTFTGVGGALAPLSMFVTGMLMADVDIKEAFTNARLYIVTLMRLVVCPLIIIAVMFITRATTYVDNGPMILLVMFLSTITPSASVITSFSQIHDKDAPKAGTLNFMTSLFCIVTMPLMVLLYCQMFGV